MKKLLKIIGGLILAIYAIVVIFLTTCLLCYNKFNVTVFGKNSFLLITEELGSYNKGDLLIVYKNDNDDIKKNDYIFFYDSTSFSNIINYARVVDKMKVTDTETTFTLDGNVKISSEYVIGKEGTVKVYHNIGGILHTLESRWGFIFFVIFPLLIVFMYEIYMLIIELKEK